jgi:hypothetical protein
LATDREIRVPGWHQNVKNSSCDHPDFLLEPVNTVRLLRSLRLPSRWQDRQDLPPGSAQAAATSVRGQFGNSIRWMCLRHGIGPGHPDWPELPRAIVAFGGSLKGFRAGGPPCGLQWWENPGVVPGMVPAFSAPAASPLPRQAVIPTRAKKDSSVAEKPSVFNDVR